MVDKSDSQIRKWKNILAIAAGITDGTYPLRLATREEVAVMVYRGSKK